MSVTSPIGSRLYSVLITTREDRPGTWLTVAADDLVDAMRRARTHSWFGDDTTPDAPAVRVSAVECLGLAWH